MSTQTAVLILAATIAVLLAAGFLVRALTGTDRGASALRRRFGPEYDHTLERHRGDTESAHRDLRERLDGYGDIRPLPLEPAVREDYTAQWTTIQERFVDAPRQAVVDADDLLARVAETEGFPDAGRREEQLAALSVHHPHHVEGMRAIRRAGRSASASTEELREALVHARALFEGLMETGRPTGAETVRPRSGRHRRRLINPKGSGA
ncbi:hypothetical protein GCM10010275_55790 [Streptomyces litmocidini]|uniref:hypothetical protein n=1 Tax=Streptomyces litmocidini TaxID=67318 RepID=UPI00167C71CA|nr:hypothetical protein [Streptomyces litmocidini]GGV08347.1 hypothetical protein GCM10010275_55790 [Streptomyces litmocidini]